MATILEQMADMVVVTEPDGKIVFVNQASQRISGYADYELIGKLPRVFKSDRHNSKFFESMWQTVLRGNIWSGQITNRKKDGSLCQESMVISPVRDKEGKIINFVSIRRDITKQLTLEEQFRQAQKMDAIGRLAGGVAHDFNNILTVINGLSELMMFDLTPGDPSYENLKEILQAGEKAANLTRQLLTFSRKQLVETAILDINEIVANMDKMLRRLIGEDIELITVLGVSPDPIEMNPGNLEQIIVNLAVNARDAMPNGGKLILETANVELDEAYASFHSGMEPGSYVMLTVTDTGCGMSPEIQSKIFEPFFTTKEVGKGTGLGLSTVYGIVQSHYGHIWVYSEETRGTIFKIYLPAVIDPKSTLAPQRELHLKGDKNVLLVEDDASVRRLGKMILTKAGFQVFEAKDGRDALQMAMTIEERIDILVTDVVMPNMSGRQLAEEIKKILPEIKVLFVSGYTDQAFAHNDELMEGDAFMQKPFTAAGFIQRINEVLQHSTNRKPN
jgi:two-component system cell cycle sensor histidine kinase/response regulator CckA